jgi:hypothetical protein
VARGFESKSVADQQESAADRTRRRQGPAIDPVLAARRRRLELARADVERRLAAASVEAHRQMLERALRALDDEIAALG